MAVCLTHLKKITLWHNVNGTHIIMTLLSFFYTYISANSCINVIFKYVYCWRTNRIVNITLRLIRAEHDWRERQTYMGQLANLLILYKATTTGNGCIFNQSFSTQRAGRTRKFFIWFGNSFGNRFWILCKLFLHYRTAHSVSVCWVVDPHPHSMSHGAVSGCGRAHTRLFFDNRISVWILIDNDFKYDKKIRNDLTKNLMVVLTFYCDECCGF